MLHFVIRLSSLTLAVATLGCGGDAGQAALAAAGNAGLKTDTAVGGPPQPSVEEQLAAFRETVVGTPPARMAGDTSRDALVRRFVRALERADTNDLRDMALNRGEFAYLYFPESRYVRPPFRQDPALTWFLIQQGSDKGLTRLLNRHGGKPLGVVGYRCSEHPERQGRTAFWANCTLRRMMAPGETTEQVFFGSIAERDGRFKFMSYRNDL